ncbi:uncharacterized protein EI90DRAFT_2906604, partial [Cantharellus anzutake]|uniref:uncharacterized protein n=1 Tax=Cantharellus anzutake TaxID=1750568 RepID=UPI001907DF66
APVIGSDKFQYDPHFLDAYVIRVLAFWRGQRDAEGVDIEDSHRCDSCGFRNGCEWREVKANEFARMATRRNIEVE